MATRRRPPGPKEAAHRPLYDSLKQPPDHVGITTIHNTVGLFIDGQEQGKAPITPVPEPHYEIYCEVPRGSVPPLTNMVLTKDIVPPKREPIKVVLEFFPFAKLSPADAAERELDKPCEEFQLFANDLHMYGLEDAVAGWRSLTEKPLPVHPADCARCRSGRILGLFFAGGVERDAHLRRAADAVATLNAREVK